MCSYGTMNDDLPRLINIIKKDNYIPEIGYLGEFNDAFYGVTCNSNEIIRIEESTGNAHIWNQLTKDKKNDAFLGNVVCIDQYMAIAPFNARNFYLFDMKENKEIPLTGDTFNSDLPIGCSCSLVNNNKLWFLPSIGDSIYNLSISDRHVKKCINIRAGLLKKYGKLKIVTLDKGVINNNVLFFPLLEHGSVIAYNIDGNNFDCYELGEIGYVLSVEDSKGVILLDVNGFLWHWNYNSLESEKIGRITLNCNKNILDLQRAVISKDRIFFLTSRYNWSVEFNFNSLKYQVLLNSDLFDIKVDKGEWLKCLKCDKNTLVFMSNLDNLYIYDLDNQTYEKKELKEE